MKQKKPPCSNADTPTERLSLPTDEGAIFRRQVEKSRWFLLVEILFFFHGFRIVLRSQVFFLVGPYVNNHDGIFSLGMAN
jgi:hypothetical protein